MRLSPSDWPSQADISTNPSTDEQKEISLHVHLEIREPIFPIDCFSSYKLIRVTGWVMRFVRNLRRVISRTPPLTVEESVKTEAYWISVAQHQCFSSELKCLNSKVDLPSLHPFVDSRGVLRVSGRDQESKLAYAAMHPVILSGKHQLRRLMLNTASYRANITHVFTLSPVPHHWW